MTKRTEEHQDERVQLYEIGYLVVPTVAEEQLPGVVQELKSILEGQGAVIHSEGNPLMRELSYSIGKSDTAYFGWIRFNVKSEVAPVIKQKVEGLEHLLRFLLIKADEDTIIIAPEVVSSEEETEAPSVDATVDIDKKIDSLITA